MPLFISLFLPNLFWALFLLLWNLDLLDRLFYQSTYSLWRSFVSFWSVERAFIDGGSKRRYWFSDVPSHCFICVISCWDRFLLSRLIQIDVDSRSGWTSFLLINLLRSLFWNPSLGALWSFTWLFLFLLTVESFWAFEH